ncbi:MAG: 16S rRNA (cytosine(1402)-N(4))-methyltransferase RsmH [Candidatus Melainabacteria bacterium]|nr:16S rRNA (cytosine(1402)-N(4))-methyltransferase RsmH [Candidatus Melainabacteria bacterium]MBI3309264.1 16S rRNA (cytosine(1402)-N(4))-methyltransferase RsmH [Candidatus Melainabacteria bacterium]
MNKQLNNHTTFTHKPVFVEEVINYLNIQEGKIYVDCTLGLGGHSEAILKTNQNIEFIGTEQDLDAFQLATKRLKQYKNCHLFNSNFTELKKILTSLNISKITGGILLDLGVSSLQLDDPKRGFSFQSDAPLDMRMNQNQSISAYEIVNQLSETELADSIYKYGEERFSRKIAKEIIRNRPINSTKELSTIVLKCYPKHRYFKTHPATKTFQAIRILVNKELENLEKFLLFIPELLAPHSRLIVISFHSLEDRIVKLFLKGNENFKVITKKPIQSSFEERKNNPRARSAKLRVAEKI